MSFLYIYFPGFVCFVLYKATISGECLQDHWSSGFLKNTLMNTVMTLSFQADRSGQTQKMQSFTSLKHLK